jgi:hypothetical protein
MPDDYRPIDTKRIEQSHEAFAMPTDGIVGLWWGVAAAESEKVDHDDAMPWWQFRDHIKPQVA